MNTTMMKFAFAAAVMTTTVGVLAQEMGGAAATSSSGATGQGGQACVAPVANLLETAPDQGPAIVADAQKSAPALPAPVENAAKHTTRNAREFVQGEISKKYVIGYDPDRGSIIQVGFAQAPVADPSASANFVEVREMLSREATLNARMQIAKLVRQHVTAMNRVSLLGTRENAEYSKKYAEQIATAAKQQDRVRVLLEKLEKAEANKLEGVTVGDRWGALMDGIIARINAKYDKAQIADDKRQQYEAVKSAYQEAKAQLDDLKQKAEAMCPPIGENESEMKAQAEFKLLGTTALLQSESFDGINFQVAAAVVWSPKLQERAVKALAFAQPPTGKASGMTLNQWLNKNREALASMVGTRQFTDDKGRYYILGISACAVSDDVNMQQGDMERADLFAQQAVMFGLFSEGIADQTAKATMYKYKGNNPNDTKSTYAKTLWEATPKNMPISGLGKCFDVQLVHPISQKEIYVSVACVDSVLASRSSKILRSMYAAATDAVVAGNYYNGEEQGMKNVHNAARQDPGAFNAGRQAGEEGLASELDSRRKKENQTGVVVQPLNPASNKSDKRKSRTGIFTGDTGINDDF